MTTSLKLHGVFVCLSLQGQDMADAATICKSNFKVKPSTRSQSSSKTVHNMSTHFIIMDNSPLNKNLVDHTHESSFLIDQYQV